MTGDIDADRSAPTDRIAPEESVTDDAPDENASDESTGDTTDDNTTDGSTTEAMLDGDAGDPEFHAARAALYGLVGGVFVYPEEELLAELTAPDAIEGVRQAGERLGLAEELSTLLDGLAATDMESLQSAYRGIFDVPEGGEYEVVPYEGHYTTGSEVSEEQRRIATVVGLMEQFDVEPGVEFDERQDHVAAELELMQVVAAQRATALFQGKDEVAETLADAEATILDKHLVGFVPAMAHGLRQSTGDSDDGDGTSVYVAAATLAERLVRSDHATHATSETVRTEGASHV